MIDKIFNFFFKSNYFILKFVIYDIFSKNVSFKKKLLKNTIISKQTKL